MRNLRGVVPSHLRERSDTLAVLDRLLDECLPPDCRRHCRVGGIQDETLTLVVDSPAWRSRLHFLSSTIIGHFNRLDKLTLSRIRIHVARPAPLTRPRPVREPLKGPPAETARALRGLADDVDEPSLARALHRLAERGEK